MKPVKKNPIVNQVVQQLTQFIQEEGLSIDSKLPTEQALCEQLQVSRSSLREAYRILQAQGYITIKPGRGAFVSSPLLNLENDRWLHQHKIEYDDLLTVREVLESFAAGVAAERITEKGLATLKRNLEDFFHHIEDDGQFKLHAELDQEFHRVIFEATSNAFLLDINTLIEQELLVFRYSMFKQEPHRTHAYDHHMRIYSAIRSRDPVLSRSTMTAHLTSARIDMDRITEQNEPEPLASNHGR